ncbi:MAG: hypothetical protein H0U76_06810 [Ktedonobacteraceae bacterium]|nr:hypothetical protein [Ktedonobacteraceae bacterium]
MTLLALVDYGFIVAFFIGLAILVLIMVVPHSQEGAAGKGAVSPQRTAATYGLVAVLFALCIVLTFFVEKHRPSLNSS